MTTTLDIKITKTSNSRLSEVDFSNIPFGKIYSDHMFVADYKDGEWSNFEIKPYGDLTLSPATSAIHYGQSVFEGLKAYKFSDNQISIFRPQNNANRLNISAQRMCMPEFPENMFLEALEALLRVDSNWVPNVDGTSLYIRPFMFATDNYVGIRPSDTYKFIIFTCPVGKYYSEPVNVKIEEEFVRSADGAAGYAKAAGNYGASLYPAKLAQAKGFHQLIWTDAKEHKYIEESGTMNVIFQIGEKLITPKSSTSILSGITRKSIVKLAKHRGIDVVERQVSVKEVIDALENGTLKDAFGAGTAATIAHINTIGFRDKVYQLPPVEEREISNKLAKELSDIRLGKSEDIFNWNYIINL